MGLLKRMVGWRRDPFPVPAGGDMAVALFEGGGSMEVVGESRYQAALRETWDACNVSGRRRRVDCHAVLQPQPGNPYDPRAVAVWVVPGGLAGYLPSREAAHWHPEIAAAWRREGKPVAVPARVVARDGGLFELRLDWPEDFRA